MSAMERIPTHIEGLDEKMQGGIPQGHICIVAGSSGAMESSFAPIRSTTSSQLARRHESVPRWSRTIGYNSRSVFLMISLEARPRIHKNPWLSGLSASPSMPTSSPFSTVAFIPHSVGWQFIGHMVRMTLGDDSMRWGSLGWLLDESVQSL